MAPQSISEKDARIEKLVCDNERIAKALDKLALQAAANEGSTKRITQK
jgi:hypothetical protein